MEIAAYVSLILILAALLAKSASYVEEAFVVLANKLRISPFIIGFAVLGIASSLPEISVAISSSISQTPELSVGNLLGASIVLLTLVLAANTIVHKEIPFTGHFGFTQVFLAFGLLLISIATLADGHLYTYEGALLIGGYAALVVYLASDIGQHHRLRRHAKIQVTKIWLLLVRGSIAVGGLLIFSHWLVEAALNLSSLLGVPSSIVGLMVLALGTNVPEISLLITSIGKNADTERLAVGNFIGSACANAPILGLLALLSPGKLNGFIAFIPAMVLLTLAIILFCTLAWTDRKLTWREGIVLVGIYIAFVIVEGRFFFIGH